MVRDGAAGGEHSSATEPFGVRSTAVCFACGTVANARYPCGPTLLRLFETIFQQRVCIIRVSGRAVHCPCRLAERRRRRPR